MSELEQTKKKLETVAAALSACSPAWLPPNVRNQRREALALVYGQEKKAPICTRCNIEMLQHDGPWYECPACRAKKQI